MTDLSTAIECFPKELWSTLDPTKYSATPNTNSIPRMKRLQIATSSSKSNGLGAFDRELSGEPQDREKNILERIANGDEDEDMAERNDEDHPPEEEVDDDYDDDEDDMAGDYNAELYFDDGGDDAGEDYDAGEADGGEY